MADTPRMNLDLSALFKDAGAQFKGLNTSQPGQWPLLPQLAAYVLAAVAVVVLGWFFLLSPTADALTAEEGREPGLKQDYRAKLAQAINLAELKKQKLQVEEYVTQLEKQLPGKAEMDALLSDINQAGIGRGLQFELFRPGQVVVKDYYAELPIMIKVTGRYHDIGSFAGDIANLSRIVTLHNLTLTVSAPSSSRDKDTASKDNAILTLDSTARTYRYLDQTEIEQVRNAAKKGDKK